MPVGVYLSYPFCAQKCSFCNFASGVFPAGLEEQYFQALKTELAEAIWIDTPDTVYLGGGTPSQMSVDHLAALLDQIPGGPWSEATIETAPGTVTPERAAAWRAVGINRVSLGVQSFSTRELAKTGRKHTASQVADEVEMLRSAGIPNINLDLIAGLPEQTIASWNTSLTWLSAIAPPHVSIYMLEVDEDSRLGQEVMLNGKRYGAPDVPADESIVDFYEMAVRQLRGMGLERYEISNFALPNHESAHNLKYWKLDPYLGFGADAHSFDGKRRWQNLETAAEYVEAMQRTGSARGEMDAAHPDQEKFFVGLRLSEGVRPNADEWRRWDAPIRQFVNQGLLVRNGDRIRLTDQGVLFSNEVFAEFVEA